MEEDKYMRRKDAADYLKAKYGVGSAQTLAKLACIGGGPLFMHYGRYPIYTKNNLDLWAASRMSAQRANTAEAA